MCVCLKDSDVRVRKTTLDLMIRLIQEDYVKLKCPYFYYVLHMLHDLEPQIRITTKSFIVNTVLTKNPKIMVQEFIQALYFLNDFDGHDSLGLAFSKNTMNPNEKKAFMISGDGNREKRRALLCFMAEHMLDDHKFKTLNSICSEIFEHVCEERIPLDNKGVPLVADAIFILGCDELKMSTTKNKSEEEDDEGAADKVQAVIQIAVDVLLKRLFQENVMPSLIKFKRKLQEVKSSLVKDLMGAIQALMREYKDWMQEVLNADSTLAAEIELDMRILNDKEDEPEEAEVSEVPSLPRVLNDSDKLHPVVSLARLSEAELNSALRVRGPSASPRSSKAASPRPSTSATPRLSLTSQLSPAPTPSPIPAQNSDDDATSASSPSQSSVVSKGTKAATPSGSPPTPKKKGKKRLSSQSPTSDQHSDSSSSRKTKKPKKANSPVPKRSQKRKKKK